MWRSLWWSPSTSSSASTRSPRTAGKGAMKSNYVITTIDSHTGGEPTRLVVSGIPLKGRTLLEQRDYLKANYDHLRSALMCEPRGHRGMFGAIMAPATRPEVDFGIIWV